MFHSLSNIATRGADYCTVRYPAQIQSTLDCRYLSLLCDNLKTRKCLQNFFPDTILGICYVFPVIQIIPCTILQPNNFIMYRGTAPPSQTATLVPNPDHQMCRMKTWL
jgi:hypothetical protein